MCTCVCIYHYDTDKTSGSAHDGRSRTKSPKIQLRGANKEPLTWVYARNIEISDDDNDETIADSVRGYCRTNGVKVARVHVIYNRYNDYIVGCKISVSNSHKHKVLSDAFWPSQIKCREWHQDSPSGNENSRRAVTRYEENTNTVSRTVHYDKTQDNVGDNASWGSQRDLQDTLHA